MRTSILKATHAGSWYPSGKFIQKSIKSSFSKASEYRSPSRTVKALISPHAGYSHCLDTAAHSFKSVDPSLYKRVIILGPSHKIRISFCIICQANSVEAPTRNIPIDLNAANQLTSTFSNLFQFLELPKAELEHSLEMMFPLIDYIFQGKEILVLPIMIGSLDKQKVESVSDALKPLILDPSTLLVISSDFCHWGERFHYVYLPEGDDQIYEFIEKLDRLAMDAISSGDIEKVRDYFQKLKTRSAEELQFKLEC
jgi:AmmeMemoRadiSam system protein B